MATYVNDLRLKEIATGDEDGTWGTSTNTNLELIGEALGYATQQSFASNANATTTVADGAADPARAMYFKVTSVTLDATRELTIAPNTLSRVMFIENATTGGQIITIKQGSGATVNIANGATKIVYLDGAGTGAAVVDALANYTPVASETWATTLAAGNASAGTDVVITAGDAFTVNTITETTSASGVTIDSVLLKDNTVKAGTATLAAGSLTDSSGAIGFGNENLVTTGTFGAGAITGTSFIIGSADIGETELEILDGATITTTELNYLDLVTLGTSAASKVVTADANNVVTFTSGIYEEFLAVTSSSNATTVNLRLGTHFLHDLTEATTFTFSNPAASGLTSTFTLKIIQDSTARAITWPAAVDWPAATAPTLTATNNGVDYFVFTTNDGGTTWYGFTAGQAMG
jgi:hypothetical protein